MAERKSAEEVAEDGARDKSSPPRHVILIRCGKWSAVVTNWGLAPFALLIIVVAAILFWAPDLVGALSR